MKILNRTLVALSLIIIPQSSLAEETANPLRPAHTYSIVARDAATGQLGAAVQSHWFSVGSSVIWARPGVGAVATQSFVEPSYGPLGLDLMEAGKSAPQALTSLMASDAHTDVRQIAMVDHNGEVMNHTGSNAIAEHCEIAGDGFSVQANMMLNSTVCAAMAKAYQASTGDLAERMMLALEAAQGEGGDVRGKQSSAMIVVSGDASLPAWGGRIIDLRVEDSNDPIIELRRLLKVARAYTKMDEGDGYVTAGDFEKAVQSYSAAEAMIPDNHEMVFWHAATLAGAGRVEESLPLFDKAFAMWPLWRELVTRLPVVGLLPDDPDLMAKILEKRD